MILTIKNLHEDVGRTLASSMGMLPINDLLAKREQLGPDIFAQQ